MTTKTKLIFGAGGIGTTAKSFTYTWDTAEKVNSLLSVLQDLNIHDLDSGASYPPTNPWNTETLLGQSSASSEGFQIATKILASSADGKPLSASNIEASLLKSLELLGLPNIELLYAHAPDPNTPLEETASAFHTQYLAGRFQKLGLCNYTGAQLKQYISICEKNGYIKPSVIQDEYNALNRSVEEEILPLCREHGMAFYGFSPLAGGFLTGKVTFSKDVKDPKYVPLPERTRWSGESAWQLYNDTFDHEHIHAAIRKLRDVCDGYGLGLAEVCLRWLVFHSGLGEEDGIILGATKEAQIRGNVADVRKGELSKELVDAVEQLHRDTKGSAKMFGN